MKISVIIPMYNESGIIEQTARALSSYMQEHFEAYEILFCDDGSSDGCGDLVRALELPCVQVIGEDQNRGKGYAVRQGMLKANGDLLMFTDADLAYGTEVIGRFADYYENHCEEEKPYVLLGSRNLDKDGYAEYTWIRRVMSKMYLCLLRLPNGLSDSQCGCKAFSAMAAKEIFSRCKVDGFAFDLETILLADHLKYSMREIPVKVIHHKQSSVRILRDAIRMLRDLRNIRKDIKHGT